LLDSEPKAAIVTVKGFIQASEAKRLRDMLEQVDSEGARRVMLDLKEVPYMASSGIGVLIAYCKAKNEKEGCGAVAVIGLAVKVQSVLTTLGLSSLIPQFNNQFSALNALGVEVDTEHLGTLHTE